MRKIIRPNSESKQKRADVPGRLESDLRVVPAASPTEFRFFESDDPAELF